MANGQLVSWINIGDEGSGAHLHAGVIAQPTIIKISASEAVAVANECFEKWGLPKRLKVDNGRPLVDTRSRDVPTLALLWFIGLGIEVIQNAPHTPQQNGIVEGLQGTCASWATPASKQTPAELEKALEEVSTFQRDHYLIPGKQNQTRRELWPEIYQTPRPYDPQNFLMQRVKNFLTQSVWVRKVKKGGGISFRGHSIFIGTKFQHQYIYLTYDPLEDQWIIRDERGALLKTSKRGIITEAQIKELALQGRRPLSETN